MNNRSSHAVSINLICASFSLDLFKVILCQGICTTLKWNIYGYLYDDVQFFFLFDSFSHRLVFFISFHFSSIEVVIILFSPDQMHVFSS